LKKKVKQLVEKQRVSGIKPKRVSKVADARRLLALYIYELQKGTVKSEDCKTMAYLLIKYAELFKIETMESLEIRLSELEEKLNA